MADWIDAEGYRANVGIVLMRPDGQVFLGRRVGGRGWQFPQGGVGRHEAPEDALFRELKEEIGLDRNAVRLLGATREWLRYDLPKRYRRRGVDSFCIGQKQRWFLLQCTQTELSFRFDATNEPEFDQFRWASWWDPVREVIFFKRPVYVQALHELSSLAHPAGLPPYPEWWEPQTAAVMPA